MYRYLCSCWCSCCRKHRTATAAFVRVGLPSLELWISCENVWHYWETSRRRRFAPKARAIPFDDDAGTERGRKNIWNEMKCWCFLLSSGRWCFGVRHSESRMLIDAAVGSPSASLDICNSNGDERDSPRAAATQSTKTAHPIPPPSPSSLSLIMVRKNSPPSAASSRKILRDHHADPTQRLWESIFSFEKKNLENPRPRRWTSKGMTAIRFYDTIWIHLFPKKIKSIVQFYDSYDSF